MHVAGATSNIKGYVESYTAGKLVGWASNGTREHVRLQVAINGIHWLDVNADQPRDDVVEAGFSLIEAGFEVEIPQYCFQGAPCIVDVTVEGTDIPVPGSPFKIDPPALEEHRPLPDLESLDGLITKITDATTKASQLMANVPIILRWLQRTVDRCNGLQQNARIGYNALNEAIGRAGGLQGSIGHLYGIIQERYPSVTLQRSASPRVSIVIPVHNQFQTTYNCIESIAASKTDTSYQLILVDDLSSDETLFASVVFQGGLTIVRTVRNEGYVGACNLGWHAATGENVLFLNNDTLVNDGWLDRLVETLDGDPRIGIVGSRLIFADGKLQEAGGIVWRDGTAWNWGRDQDKMHPQFSFMRDVDYVSGAALMIRRSLLDKLGGFDTYYAPAYYEDTDICFRARAEGYRVVMQPASTIVHLEGQSNGTSTSSGLKRYQLINARKFNTRWAATLKTHRANGRDPALEAERLVVKRALFVDESTPTPDQDAGSNAAFEHMLSLQRLGYKIVFLPADNMAHIPPYTDLLQSKGIECWYAPYAWSVEEYFRRSSVQFDLIYVHRKSNAQRYLQILKKYQKTARILFNYADIHAVREIREANLGEPSPELMQQLERKLEEELDITKQVDAVIVHSSFEKQYIMERRPKAKVFLVPWTFKASEGPLERASRNGIVFVGGFGHPPNVDAVDWFVESIWPQVHPHVGDHPFNIVGSHMPERLKALQAPRVNPMGFVPDLDALLDRTFLTVAPLRYGAGLKGKVLSSLARGVPCVMTPMAAEGMDLPEDLRMLVAESEADMSRTIIELCLDAGDRWQRLAEASRQFVRERFSRDEIDRLLRGAVGSQHSLVDAVGQTTRPVH